jgi:hypothetical protein
VLRALGTSFANSIPQLLVHNKLTDERWALQRPYPRHPLEICARLCMEDFNIMVKSPFSGTHTL